MEHLVPAKTRRRLGHFSFMRSTGRPLYSVVDEAAVTVPDAFEVLTVPHK
jgi:hypothetical protein